MPDLPLLRASGWLELILVGAKMFCANLPGETRDWLEHFVALAASSFRDVLFALVCGAIGELLNSTSARRPRLARCVRFVFLTFFTLCAAYAVVSVGIFRYFLRPLTYELFGLVGNATTIRSSIVERITPLILIAFLVVPALFVFLATRRPRIGRKTLIALAFAVAWLVTGWALHAAGRKHDNLQHLGLNPHTEIARSTALRLLGNRRPAFPKDAPPELVQEFRTFGARGPGPLSHFKVPPGVGRPRNAIVIVLESIGTKYLGLYGNPVEVTPTLTRESKSALVFENIYAHASFTYASFRSINFSVYPGLPWHYALLEDGRPLPETLATLLKRRGMRTAYLTSGDLDWGDQRWLLEGRGGFDIVEGASSLGCPLLSSWGTEDRCLFDRLMGWIAEKPAEPFFAVCWTDQTHDPYLVSPGIEQRDFFAGKIPAPAFAADLSRYLNILHNTDAQLARLFAFLRERGIADDTLVIVTGDHGEAFADPHGQRGHAWSVHEEEVRVPLLIWNPRLFPAGARSAAIGGHVDLNPTLADLLEAEPAREWQGYSLFDPGRPNRAFLMAIAGGDVFGIRDGDWKYIYDVASGRELLFNLANDPTELRDLAAEHPAVSTELRQRVGAWVTFEDAFLQGRTN